MNPLQIKIILLLFSNKVFDNLFMEKIKIGLFGVGHLGKIHLKLLTEIPDFEVVGFFDTNPIHSQEVEADTGLRAFDSPEKLLEQVDAIDIVSTTSAHYELAFQSISQQKHTFIEKPIVSTLEQCRSIYEIAKQGNVKVQVGYVERFNPAFMAAAPYVDNPKYIESQRVAEFNHRGSDVSVVLDMMIHDIDIVMQIVKSPVAKVQALGVPVISNTPDIAQARLEFENGCVANFSSSRIAIKKSRKTRIFQRDCYISIDFLEKSTKVFKLKDPSGNEVPTSIINTPDGGQKGIFVETPSIFEVNAIKTELEGFARAIKENIDPPVTIHEGYASMEIAFEILHQIETNRNQHL